MKILFWAIVAGLVLLAMFAVANWSVLTAPTNLNLLAFEVEGPLGAILLGATLVLIGLCILYVLSVRTAMLVETRRQARELNAQRELADRAELSRFTELRGHVDSAAECQRALTEEAQATLVARIDALERTVVDSLHDSTNSVAAHVGQVDEKLERMVPRPQAQR